ncbi:hypothetical protein HDU67_009751 [Dinochytrium kinnereticum]|nr:hypothetical protein HDU67_009751 [Dinochytrium kinnereticum]
MQVEALCIGCKRKYGSEPVNGDPENSLLSAARLSPDSLTKVQASREAERFLQCFAHDGKKAFDDFIHAILAVPELMEVFVDSPFSYKELASFAEAEFRNVAGSLKFLQTQRKTQIYVAAVFVPKLKRGFAALEAKTVGSPTESESRAVTTSEHSIAAFTVAQILPQSHHIWLHHLVLRSPLLQQGTMDRDLFCKLIDNIEAEEESSISNGDKKLRIQPERFIFLRIPKMFAKLRSQLSRIGFSDLKLHKKKAAAPWHPDDGVMSFIRPCRPGAKTHLEQQSFHASLADLFADIGVMYIRGLCTNDEIDHADEWSAEVMEWSRDVLVVEADDLRHRTMFKLSWKT